MENRCGRKMVERRKGRADGTGGLSMKGSRVVELPMEPHQGLYQDGKVVGSDNSVLMPPGT